MTLGSTHALTEMSTRGISWGQSRPMRSADNFSTFMYLMSRNSGILNLPVTEGLNRACNEIALPSFTALMFGYYNRDVMYLFGIRFDLSILRNLISSVQV